MSWGGVILGVCIPKAKGMKLSRQEPAGQNGKERDLAWGSPLVGRGWGRFSRGGVCGFKNNDFQPGLE